MTEQTLVDNDVLIKGSAYALWALLDEEMLGSVGVLGAARYVVPDAIQRNKIDQRGRALDAWCALLSDAEELEPTADELQLATLLEESAHDLGIPLDPGESQLCAMAVHRPDSVMLTGDKRAIAAAERLRGLVGELARLDGRVACLEQLLQSLSVALGAEVVRGHVCSEPAVDRAISICFSCASQHDASIDESGLASYIENLRSSAPRLLAASL